MLTRVVLSFSLLAAVPLTANGQIRVLTITSSATFTTGLLKPGSLASIFCTGLTVVPDLVAADGYPLPRTLAGVRVTFGATDARILAVANLAGGAYQQINVQIPWEVTDTSILDVNQNGASAHFATPSFGWPVFFVDPSGYAIAQHAAGYRPVTPADPAKPGEWVIVYATNLGPVQNQPADGNPADPQLLSPILPDPSPHAFYFGLVLGPPPVSAQWPTHIASNYMGMTPGSIVYQANMQVPADQPPGDLVFLVADIWDCGFFFVQGCGRDYSLHAASDPARIPVGN